MSTKIPQPTCPECEKLSKVSKESNAIGDFLNWMQQKGLVIGSYEDDGLLYSAHVQPNAILAEYFEIDMDKVEEERRALLEWLQGQYDEDDNRVD